MGIKQTLNGVNDLPRVSRLGTTYLGTEMVQPINAYI